MAEGNVVQQLKKLKIEFNPLWSVQFSAAGGIYHDASGCDTREYDWVVCYRIRNVYVHGITEAHRESCEAAAKKGKWALARWIAANCVGVGRCRYEPGEMLRELEDEANDDRGW